jgi:hypothetical protein
MLEQIVVPSVDLGPNLMSFPLLAIELETLAPSWAISDVPAHLISTHAWEKSTVLHQT